MAKIETDTHPPSLGGFYLPHKPVNWTGEILDLKTGELVKEPSMTKQSFMADCDINNIIKAFSATGVWNHINERAAQGVYTDLPDPIDFQQSLQLVRDAEASFASLPAAVRARFENNPEQFLAFVADPRNQEEMIKLGLATDNRPPQPKEEAPPPPPPDTKQA